MQKHLLFNNPLSSDKADRLISLLNTPASATVLDVGCGDGELLIRVVEASNATGLGIDNSASCVANARENAAGRIPEGLCEFRESDIRSEEFEDATFDLAICVGATHAFGTGDNAYPNAIQTLSRLVRPGGLILIGEGYWKQSPAPAYVDLIGQPVGVYHSHEENISYAESEGLVTLYATVSNDDEWDHFEWSHQMRVERQAALNPSDRELAKKLKRRRQWLDGYLRWGRTTMGFGFYVFTSKMNAT